MSMRESPIALAGVVVGWLSFFIFSLIPVEPSSTSTAVLWLLLLAIVAVIVVCAFGVLHHAESLAHRLGDPYGTLVLTLSIVSIEVTLIAAVLFGPGDHTTVARDSTLAGFMLFLGFFLGLAMVIASIRHGSLRFNRPGLSLYLVMLIIFGSTAFVVPHLIGTDGSFSPQQTGVIIVVTAAGYALFLRYQTGSGAKHFQEVVHVVTTHDATNTERVWPSAVLLFVTAVPIVLLSHSMAGLLDEALVRASAPSAISGLVIATIVLMPEALTTLRAAWAGENQRVSNLTHGAMVSVVCMTIPVVLTIALVTNQTVIFAESATNLVLLAILAASSIVVAVHGRATVLFGVVHIAICFAYLVSVFI